MVRWVIGTILQCGPIELFLVPTSVPRMVNTGRGICYPVSGMMHTKEPLLLIGKSARVAAAGFLSR